MEIPLLREIVIIFALSIAVLLVCHRLHIPILVGFILTGILSGPHGLGLVGPVEDVEILAKVGVILLLFIIGMEFSLRRLLALKSLFFLGGGLQVGLTLLGGFLIAQSLGRPLGESIFLGCLLSLSSTAIVLKLLNERAEENSPHGRVALSILIFQDLLVVPMLLVTPVLAGVQSIWDPSFLVLLYKSFLILLVAFLLAEKAVPVLFFHVAKTRSRDLFLLTVFSTCFSVTWLASAVGLPISLGAFLAGLVLGESEYRHQAIGNILPFQDVFMSFFFISIGMLLNINFITERPFLIFAIALGVLVLKFFTAGIATLLLGFPLRTIVLSGLALSQVGEFSFILAKSGMRYNLGTEFHYQLFLAVSLLTMIFTPALTNLAPHVANLIFRLPLPEKIRSGLRPYHEKEPMKKKDHLIIVGFGVTGRYLAKSCKASSIDYAILDMHSETVALEKSKGEPIQFGDATHATVLRHANIKEARALALAINDPSAAQSIVKTAKNENPNIYIITRNRNLKDLGLMRKLGANDIITDEFESSVAMFARVLQEYLIPKEEIEKLVNQVRVEVLNHNMPLD